MANTSNILIVIQSALVCDSEIRLKMVKPADCREYPLCSVEDKAETKADYIKLFQCNLHI